MTSLEIARRFAELNEKTEAQNAYTLALGQEELSPEEQLEAASYIFFSEGDHRIAFTTFISLFNGGYFRQEIWELVTQAFYLPNAADLQKRYETNCKLLGKYPYIFRKDFPDFTELTTIFFPFDDRGFVPYFPEEGRFGEYIDLNTPIIDRWFFKDLSKPILADDVYSQYQLEYLNDTVRKSKWVAMENHIYLHYTNWQTFCAYLQLFDLKRLLNDEKFVFLMEEEVSRYPIDFKAEFGIDYSKYPVKPLGIREVNRMIWHNQLSTSNGGDFFNEIFYGHPNLLALDSLMLETVEELIQQVRDLLPQGSGSKNAAVQALAHLKNPTDKDILVAVFLYSKKLVQRSDPNARIAPALFFQPHFGNIYCTTSVHDRGRATFTSNQYEEVHKQRFFQEFPYIKTFTPMRRLTTSYASSVRTMVERLCITDEEKKQKDTSVMKDQFLIRLLNRQYLIDPEDRLCVDSRLVRFEDGKLNPKATFTALAEFLDIPYTESMTYCSGPNGVNPLSFKGNVIGFDTATVYRTYDDYANDEERAVLEYFMRDAYEAYGYDFHYYHGEPVDEAWLDDKLAHFDSIDRSMEKSWRFALQNSILQANAKKLEGTKMTLLERPKDLQDMDGSADELAMHAREIKILEDHEGGIQHQLDRVIQDARAERERCTKLLFRNLFFVNKNGQPLRMQTPLKLDPALLENPMYH